MHAQTSHNKSFKMYTWLFAIMHLCALAVLTAGSSASPATLTSAQNGSLIVNSESDVFIKSAGRVFINGREILREVNDLTSQVNALIDILATTTTSTTTSTSTTTTTTTTTLPYMTFVSETLSELNPSFDVSFDTFGKLVIGCDQNIESVFLFGQLEKFPFNAHLTDCPITHLDFGQLTNFGGDLIASIHYNLELNGLKNISFGNIRRVEGRINLYNNDLTHVEFNELSWIDGTLEFSFNQLTTLDLSPLTYVGGSLGFPSNKLEYINFGDLTTVEEIDLGYNRLTEVDFGHIVRVERALYLRNNPLKRVDFGQITYIGSVIYLQGQQVLEFVNCTGVTIMGCICVQSGVTLNCPQRCSGSPCISCSSESQCLVD